MDKIAAIWARVSTADQTSLPDQMARTKEKLQDKGYIVPKDRILAVEWTSLDLFNCPEFLTLAGWVKRKEIQALAIFDRDRLQAEPAQRLVFLADLKEAGIELIICQGPPMLEGDWGNLIEHVHAIAKKQQVLRARLGAKDGLHDKVMRDRKPTSRHRVFGYRWETELKLVPNEEWKDVKQIFKMVLEGMPYRRITKELEKHVIPSPKGNKKWEISTLSAIIRNPIYAGRYYALGREVRQPSNRRGMTYGNSSALRLPLEKRFYLKEVEVVNPPITWEQYSQILERVKKNKELAKRHATHDYLLRGFIFCDKHLGKNGKPLHFYGQPSGRKWAYNCPIGGCPYPRLNGPDIEDEVIARVKSLISMPPHMFYEHIGNRKSRAELQLSLRVEIDNLDTKYNKNINAETELASLIIRGKISDEAYDRERSLLMAERNWIDERKGIIKEELDKSNRQGEAVAALDQIKATLSNDFANLTNDQWRELFKTLNLEVHIPDKLAPERTWHGQPIESYLWADVRFGISIVPIKEVTDIVFTRAGSVTHSRGCLCFHRNISSQAWSIRNK
jgi:DNA invertase Pin-like site-specific DNA recombinase